MADRVYPKVSPYAYKGLPGTYVNPAPPPIVPARVGGTVIPRATDFLPRRKAGKMPAATGAPGATALSSAGGVPTRKATPTQGITATRTGTIPPDGKYPSNTSGGQSSSGGGASSLGPMGVPMSGSGGKCCGK